jgi:hypothetical protein
MKHLMKFIAVMKYSVKLITALAMLIAGLAFAAPAANADTNGFQFTILSSSHGVPTVSTTLSNTQDALVGGATQMLWEDQNFNGHLTPANVKSAFAKRIKVIATGANSSQVIYRMSHHRKEVVVKPGSKLRNTGLHNHISGGFVWTTGLAVLRYDAASHQYRHAANLLTNAQLQQVRVQNPHKVFKVVGRVKLGHKVYNIVVWCGNFIGGNVVMFTHVVQVPLIEDLLLQSNAESVAAAKVTFNFQVSCPSNGANFTAEGYAWAYGRASSQITYTQRTRATVINGLETTAKQSLSINQSTEADAEASVTVSGSCGSTTYQPPTASGNAKSCVKTGQQDGVITASGTNPNSVAASGTLIVGGQSHSFTSVGAGQTVNWDFSGFAPGDYQGSFTLGSPVNMSASFTVHVAECPTPTMLLSLDRPNDLDQSIAHPGGSIDWSYTPTMGHSVAPDGAGNVTYTVQAVYGSVKFITANSPCDTNGLRNNVVTTLTEPSGTYDIALCYIASTEDPASYGGTDTITLTSVFAGKTYQASQPITINPTPVIPG